MRNLFYNLKDSQSINSHLENKDIHTYAREEKVLNLETQNTHNCSQFNESETSPLSIDEKEILATAAMYLMQLQKSHRDFELLKAMNPLMNHEYLQGSLTYIKRSIEDIKSFIEDKNTKELSMLLY